MNGYLVGDYVADLRKITDSTQDERVIFTRLAPCALKLAADQGWVRPEHYATDPDQGIGVHLLHEEEDHSLAVFVVSWAPGRGVAPHDHGTWAVVANVEGPERNVRYKRLDDRARADFAELAIKDERITRPGDVLCIRSGGIHAVWNDSDAITLSLHTYGRHINHTGRSQYDVETKRMEPLLLNMAN